MKDKIKLVSKSVVLMDKQLRDELLIKDGTQQKKKLWENTYIKKQIDKRKNGDTFTISDHIQAMIYSMLSSGIAWERVEKGIDSQSGQIIPIDEIFCNYDTDILLKSNPEQLCENIKALRCASQYTYKQMQALININIKKLLSYEKQYGCVDNFYQHFINADSSLKTLVLILSNSNSNFKMEQMGEALVAEYLKNVGYDVTKPDRHIRRILGSDILGCSDRKTVPITEAFDIVAKIADELKKPIAEVDYILWSYCAKGYGEVCTVNKPQCSLCVARQLCQKETETE